MPHREHSVETIRRNSEVMGNLRKLMVVNRGVRLNKRGGKGGGFLPGSLGLKHENLLC